ncbi:MAG: SDR family NAD(P)-dependent oxidoreductase, partial [Chloroflexi bacterium]|nr:SDR family NAD(P)-dependent oxidoreductase [Chloroflexota bacterium]
MEGKVVVITGAAGAIGSVTARVFAEAGARVTLIDVREDRLYEQCEDLASKFGAQLVPNIDATDLGSVEHMVQQVLDKHGSIYGLINVAGGFRSGSPVHETDLKTWELMINLNARSVFVASHAVIPHIIEGGQGGRIANFSAKPALSAGKGNSAYAASKAAVLRLTESMALELKKHRINVNAVLPGIVNTPANREAMPDADHDSWVTPQQVAYVLRFLFSDEAVAVNAAGIPVTGYA